MEKWRTERLATLHLTECGWPLSANMAAIYYARNLGLRWHDAYLDPDVIRLHMPMDYDTLNKGRAEKGLGFRAFPRLKQLRPRRNSMQSCAGVPRFAEIVTGERDHKSPLGYYNQLAKELDISIHGDPRHLELFEGMTDHSFVRFIHELIVELNAAGLTHYLPDCLYDESGSLIDAKGG
jgi:hypothetical protein